MVYKIRMPNTTHPSYIANLLDKPLEELQDLIYYNVRFDRNSSNTFPLPLFAEKSKRLHPKTPQI